MFSVPTPFLSGRVTECQRKEIENIPLLVLGCTLASNLWDTESASESFLQPGRTIGLTSAQLSCKYHPILQIN